MEKDHLCGPRGPPGFLASRYLAVTRYDSGRQPGPVEQIRGLGAGPADHRVRSRRHRDRQRSGDTSSPRAECGPLLKAVIDDPSPWPFRRGGVRNQAVRFGVFDEERAGAPGSSRITMNPTRTRSAAGATARKYIDADSIGLWDIPAARSRRQPYRFKRTRQTLDAAIKLVDPVWGGVFQYSEAGSWTRPAFRKKNHVRFRRNICATTARPTRCGRIRNISRRRVTSSAIWQASS